MLSQEFALSIKDAAFSIRSTDTIQAETGEEISVTVDASTDHDENVTILFAKIVSFFIISDQNMNLKVNTTDETHALVANKPFWWHNALPGSPANPITHNITKLTFVNTPNAVPAVIKAGFLVTP